MRNREQEDKRPDKMNNSLALKRNGGFRPGCGEVKYDPGSEAQPPESLLVTDVDLRQVNHKIGSKEAEDNNCGSLAQVLAPMECWHGGRDREVEDP